MTEGKVRAIAIAVVSAIIGKIKPEVSDEQVVEAVEPAEDDIPEIFFGAALPQTKTDTVMTFRYISKTEDFNGYCITKAQGSSSMDYPKKNQTVKLYEDAACETKHKMDFKGRGKQNKFVLKANWIDLTHARNVVSARLWGDMVKSRANYNTIPELLRTSPNQGAVDGFPVKVYAGGIYQGRYTMNIPKDAWMANMDDDLDNHAILCSEGYSTGCFRKLWSEVPSGWSDEVHDTPPAAIWNRWDAVIRFVQNATNEEFVAGIDNYIDLESLIDYHIFMLLCCGLDAYGKNQLYMTYDGQKWYASAYDMDSTWGLWWTGTNFVPTDYRRSQYQDFADGEGNLLFIRLEQLFIERIKTRWAEVKDTVLSVASIINRFERFTDIAPPHLVAEDYATTTGGGAYTKIPSKDANNIQQIRAYVVARHAWTDGYISNLLYAPCESISLSPTTLSFTAEGSQTITATTVPADTSDEIIWISSDPTIASVQGGIVTAVSDGSCTITAKCGDCVTSCVVTVNGVYVDPDLLFRLPAETAFDGVDDYIDTGLKLWDEPKTFTMLIKADLTQTQSSTMATVFHCIDETTTAYPGLALARESESTYHIIGATLISSGVGCYWARNIPMLPKTAIAIVVVNGKVTNVEHLDAEGLVHIQGVVNGKDHIAHENSLILGAYRGSSGNIGRFYKGTIYDLQIWGREFSAGERAAYITSD